MATEPVTRQCGGSGGVEEPWAPAKLNTIGGHSSPLQNQDVPGADPEEDVSVPPEHEAAHENVNVSIIKMEDDPGGVTACQDMLMESEPPEEHQDKEPLEEHLSVDEAPFPPPPLLGGSAEEPGAETEVFSSLQEETDDCVNYVDDLSDPVENPAFSDAQNDQESLFPLTHVEPVDRALEPTTEEIKESVEAEGEVQEDSLLPILDMCNSNQDSSDTADPAQTEIPPLSIHTQEATNSLVLLDTKKSPMNCAEYPGSTQPVILAGQQQVEQLPSGQAEGGPEGHNQEAAQQVHSQGFSPLSAVVMEPANQNAEGSQGFGCVVAVSEGQRRAGEQRDREACQVEEKAKQKEGGLGSDSESERLTHSPEMVRCSEMEGSRDRIIILEKHSSLSMPKLSGGSGMDSDPYDDSQSDSGVSTDFSTSSTFESPIAKANMDVVKPPANETPIEREIRRAVQREESLRRSRGIKNVSPTTEYVEIPLTKSVLYPGLPVKWEKSQGKDRQFAGKKMQKEIHAEVQREQALVKLGTVPGIYDKGTVRQLKERKELFEAFQEPRDSSGNLTPRTMVPSWASANDRSPQENQENASTPASHPGGMSVGRGRSVDLLNQKQQQQQQQQHSSTSSTSPRGPGLSEGNGCQVIILESNLPSLSLYPPQPLQQNHRPASLMQTQVVDVIDSGTSNASPSLGRGDYRGRTEREVEEEDGEESVPKENPFFKLRSSLLVDKVEQDIREAQERERELRRQRTNLYGAAEAGREERASEGRGLHGGGRQLSLCSFSAPSFNLPAFPAQPVSPTHRVPGPPAVRQSLGRLGMWPPSQAEENQVIQLESPRQKTPLLQHWETGLVNNGHPDQNH